MNSSLFKHGFVVAGILFFVLLFLVPAAHYRPRSPHSRCGSTSGLVAVLHSIRSFIRTRNVSIGSDIAAMLIDVSSLSRVFITLDSSLSESGPALLSPILRC